ncbi:MAG: hypothetical protein IKE75_06005 [Bacilli bacterium]|nr:hypothetical protein [Bacilli bacterium]
MSESVRKSIKRIAFEEPKGEHIKAFILYLLVLSMLSYVGIYFIKDSNLVVLFAFIISLPLYLNFMKLCLDASRDELIGFGSLFQIRKYSFKFSLYYGLIVLIFYLLNIIINLIPMGFVLCTVIFVYIFPILIMLPFVFLDNVNQSFKDLIINSFTLVNKTRILFYGLLCSFVIWFFLGFLTLGVLYIWLIPYMFISASYLYLFLKKEKSFKTKKSLSNIIIIILVLLLIVCLNILSFKIYPNNFDNFKENLNITNN